MSELRSYSSRARITATSFVNEYSWGSFKGSEDRWMETYFDAFLYLANWGTHILKLRLPARLLDVKTARWYCRRSTSAREKSENVILTFLSEEEGDDEWVEGEGRLSSLISVRSDLARGDMRALYLGWLLCAQNGELDPGETEPPIPAGLGQLSAALTAFARFLRIDEDLIAAAAAASSPLAETEPNSRDIREWLAGLPLAEKDEFLARLIIGNEGALGHEIIQRMRRERTGTGDADRGVAERRTVASLVRAGEQVTQERLRIAAEKAAREKTQRERTAARKRAMHLDTLEGQEALLWKKVASQIAVTQPRSYDQAVELLMDLRDLAARRDDPGFRRQIEELRAAHKGKRTLIARLDKAGL